MCEKLDKSHVLKFSDGRRKFRTKDERRNFSIIYFLTFPWLDQPIQAVRKTYIHVYE